MSKLFLSLSLFVALAFSSQAQNIVKNGNFKSGLSEWKVSTDNQKEIKLGVSTDYASYGLSDSHIGMSFVHINSQAGIEQSLATTVGEDYVVGFGFSHLPSVGDKQIIVNIDGKPVYTYTVKQSDVRGFFQHKSFTFKVQKEETNIRIYIVSLGGDEKKGILLSDIICDVEAAADLKLYYSY
jgi:hypothetical protein